MPDVGWVNSWGPALLQIAFAVVIVLWSLPGFHLQTKRSRYLQALEHQVVQPRRNPIRLVALLVVLGALYAVYTSHPLLHELSDASLGSETVGVTEVVTIVSFAVAALFLLITAMHLKPVEADETIRRLETFSAGQWERLYSERPERLPFRDRQAAAQQGLQRYLDGLQELGTAAPADIGIVDRLEILRRFLSFSGRLGALPEHCSNSIRAALVSRLLASIHGLMTADHVPDYRMFVDCFKGLETLRTRLKTAGRHADAETVSQMQSRLARHLVFSAVQAPGSGLEPAIRESVQTLAHSRDDLFWIGRQTVAHFPLQGTIPAFALLLAAEPPSHDDPDLEQEMSRELDAMRLGLAALLRLRGPTSAAWVQRSLATRRQEDLPTPDNLSDAQDFLASLAEFAVADAVEQWRIDLERPEPRRESQRHGSQRPEPDPSLSSLVAAASRHLLVSIVRYLEPRR